MGPLLIHLPGSDLVWGSLEVAQGSVVHGASRLVKGMVRAMLLALFVALGWQVPRMVSMASVVGIGTTSPPTKG